MHAEMKTKESKRKQMMRVQAALEAELQSFLPLYRDLNDYVAPSRGRFFVQDVNKGDRRNLKILDSTGSVAARTLVAGLLSGFSSPARPWIRMTVSDPDLAEMDAVKEWLHVVTLRILSILSRSNIYQTLPSLYEDGVVFATGALLVEEHPRTLFHTESLPVGSYTIGKDEQGRVNVFFRKFRMTVRQVLQKFGRRKGKDFDWSNISDHVKSRYTTGNLEDWVDITHAIQPNPDYNPDSPWTEEKEFSSCYFETGSSGGNTYSIGAHEEDRYLRESGYDYFPVLVFRWGVKGEDVYGTDSPGIMALGDIKALQIMQKYKAEAVQKMVRPPMTGPVTLMNKKTSILSGDVTLADVREGQLGFRPTYQVDPKVGELIQDIQDHQRRINEVMYTNIVLMMANSDRRQITAREIDAREGEKMLVFGAVGQRLNYDVFDPLTEIVFKLMEDAGMIPEPPEEIRGMPLKIEYISIMAQAQKLVGLSGLQATLSIVGQLQPLNPEIMDKFDADQFLDEYADVTGVPPRVIVDDEVVAQMRASRAQAMAQQQKVATLRETAATAKDLSAAKTGDESALSLMLQSQEAGAIGV